MFKNNGTFYPTPPDLIDRMMAKVNRWNCKMLEPSAGKGDIIEHIKDIRVGRYHTSPAIYAIEKDEDLQATLRGKGIELVDTDFLTYSGLDKFDLIMANPPFDEGDKHLLKALEIMYRGQIVFLLNAETIRNPYTNNRKLLVRKLEEHDAEIEYIQGAFASAERPTGVEVALVNIIIDRKVEDDLFKGCDDEAQEQKPEFEEKYEVSTGRDVHDLVADYNNTVSIGIETITSYYRNYRKIRDYIGLNREPGGMMDRGEDLTAKMQNQVNDLLRRVRKDYWRSVLNLREVNSRLTGKKQEEFEHLLNERQVMDFTENNIRQFVLNVINGYEKTIMDSVLEIFDKFTVRHSYSGSVREKNIHYFNGWKTNNAFKVNKKVVIPIYGILGDGPFQTWRGGWSLDHSAARELRDIDLVMNYCDGMRNYYPLTSAIDSMFAEGENRGIQSTYFKADCFKKGTIHLTFKDENIRRRFNVLACIGKGWLPESYGKYEYAKLPADEQAVVDSFEGRKSYDKHVGESILSGGRQLLQIAA